MAGRLFGRWLNAIAQIDRIRFRMSQAVGYGKSTTDKSSFFTPFGSKNPQKLLASISQARWPARQNTYSHGRFAGWDHRTIFLTGALRSRRKDQHVLVFAIYFSAPAFTSFDSMYHIASPELIGTFPAPQKLTHSKRSARPRLRCGAGRGGLRSSLCRACGP